LRVHWRRNLLGQSEPENIKAILADQFEDFELGWKRHQYFSPFLGNGIFTVDGLAWKHSRDLLRPNFTKVELDSSLQSLETHVKHFLVQLPRDGSTVDLQQLFFKLTMDASTEFLFGTSTNSLLPESQKSLESFSEAFEEAQWGLSLRPRLGALNYVYTNRKFVKACKVLHSYVDNFVHTCLAESTGDEKRVLESGQNDTTSPKQKYCFLQELAKDVRDPKELRDHALNVLIAGRDTTAGLLAITFFVLARRPDVWSKLRKSVENLHGQRPTFEQLKEMRYLQFVLKEGIQTSLMFSLLLVAHTI
jgi:cytochrome P450